MPHPCTVCGRSRMNPSNREEDYLFFGFPVNYEDRCKSWLEFCCRDDLYKLSKKQLLQRMICSKHFEKKDFLNEYQDRLSCTGIPTLYDPTQSLYNIVCVICAKVRKDPRDDPLDNTTFHHFPGEEFRCLKWLDFVGVDAYYRLTRKEIMYCYICSNHFDKSQFVAGYKGRLVDDAVPNIRYPGEVKCLPSPKTDGKYAGTGDPESEKKTMRCVPLSTAILESQACAACGRSRSDPRNRIEKYRFHPFPAYEVGRCLRWCQFLGREDLLKMSPNQIRKLVLCSKHFLSGSSFHKTGPCDAVPTIKQIQYRPERNVPPKLDSVEHEENENECNGKVSSKSGELARPSVSSKKPKVDNRPAPLAKKRGRSKRPTFINIPTADSLNIENQMKKLPIPPASWKLHLGNNQFQPLTIANSNIANTITTDGKKVILPFTGNISNLGAPIPVNSLSSIPPGFLIKINLPEQMNKKPVKAPRQQSRTKKTNAKTTNRKMKKTSQKRRVSKKSLEQTPKLRESNEITETIQNVDAKPMEVRKIGNLPIIIRKADDRQIFVQRINETPVFVAKSETKSNIVRNIDPPVANYQTAMTPEDIKNEMCEDTEILDEELIGLADSYVSEEEQVDHYMEEMPIKPDPVVDEIKPPRETKKRPKMTAKMRRTLLPIRMEVRSFLNHLRPHVSRLPRKAKAQLKLSIVNLVIDRL